MTLLNRTFITITLAAASVCSCTIKSQPGDSLALAEDQCAAGHYQSAQQICSDRYSFDSTDTVSVDRLCRLALLNAILAEHIDEDANLATAARYMREAIHRDPDSVAVFISALEVEDRSRTAFINQIIGAVDFPIDSVRIYHDEMSHSDIEPTDTL